MSKEIDLANRLYNTYSNKIEGLFFNTLWQILVNYTIARDGKSAFVYIPVGPYQVGIATLNEGGYRPMNFHFKDDVPKEERLNIIKVLNEEVFHLTPDQVGEIELSSYRKPPLKATGHPKIHIYDYSEGQSKVLIALQVRRVGRLGTEAKSDFLPPTYHRIPSTKIAFILAQFHANVVGKEIRLTFPEENTLKEEGDGARGVEYVSRLNGEYFRPE